MASCNFESQLLGVSIESLRQVGKETVVEVQLVSLAFEDFQAPLSGILDGRDFLKFV